ncbi:hypothetical protein ARALYDRAFT_343087 [Arabidopsis lyrata subsp. lyrata]|uniref:O-fucosyltransferase family protein n=1 Tax=Arabidopsis lyrata subsp. lyrata TaxID=81972 RepID=D7L2Q3_ARALL|nr:hypothetical protein ARALYDRAFT_343087 [Arabidopsis lyrata subsp. lyrata]
MFFYDVAKKESTYEGRKVSISRLNERGKKYNKRENDIELAQVISGSDLRGELFGGSRALEPLAKEFSNLVTKETLAHKGELLPYTNRSSALAAIDYIVSLSSDVFLPSHGGNMAKAMQNSSVSDAELSFVTRKLHRKYQGHLESPRRRRDRDVIAYPVPECMFLGSHGSGFHTVRSLGIAQALNENGKQPLRWVNLNKEERDDLAMFLSGSSQTSESLNSDNINLRDSSTSSVAEDLHIDERGSLESGDKKAGTRRRWSSPNVPNISALRINVPVNAKEDERKKFLSQIEDTPKEKGSKPLFWLQRCRDYNQLPLVASFSLDHVSFRSTKRSLITRNKESP